MKYCVATRIVPKSVPSTLICYAGNYFAFVDSAIFCTFLYYLSTRVFYTVRCFFSGTLLLSTLCSKRLVSILCSWSHRTLYRQTLKDLGKSLLKSLKSSSFKRDTANVLLKQSQTQQSQYRHASYSNCLRLGFISIIRPHVSKIRLYLTKHCLSFGL